MSDSELRSFLQERKYYNITSGRVETVPSGAAVGQPPVSSDQGSIRLTCASHSVGKADVAILDEFGYNSNQVKFNSFVEHVEINVTSFQGHNNRKLGEDHPTNRRCSPPEQF